jgi:hypothetical protein
MNNYFAQIEHAMGEAVQRNAHKPRRLRLLHGIRRHPGLVVAVTTGLVFAAPAVGAITQWYGLGAANQPQSMARAFGVGRAVAGSAKLLPLRVADPRGGPPWGIRLVRTQHGSCAEVGRVEDGRLGSLGIDGYWHDDRLFHPYPTSWVGGSCGTGSGGGGAGGIRDASANIPTFRNTEQTDGCVVEPAGSQARTACPLENLRIVISVSLGPRVTSITYRTATGKLATEESPASHGTFLFVFPLNAATCRRVLQGRLTTTGSCDVTGGPTRSRFANPFEATIARINLRNGKSCRVTSPVLLSNCPRH